MKLYYTTTNFLDSIAYDICQQPINELNIYKNFYKALSQSRDKYFSNVITTMLLEASITNNEIIYEYNIFNAKTLEKEVFKFRIIKNSNQLLYSHSTILAEEDSSEIAPITYTITPQEIENFRTS